MNILKVALILAGSGITSSVVSGASLVSGKRIAIQIDKLTDPELIDIFKSPDEEHGEHHATDTSASANVHAKYEAFKKHFDAKKDSVLAELAEDERGIKELQQVAPFNNQEFKAVFEKGDNIIESVRRDWGIRTDALGPFEKNDITLSQVEEELSKLKKGLKSIVQGLIKICSKVHIEGLTGCFSGRPGHLLGEAAKIKKWAFAQEMFGHDKVEDEWVKPDWKPALVSLNGPRNRFAISSVSEDLNLEALKARQGGSLSSAISALRANFESLKESHPQLKNAFELRGAVIDAMLSPLDYAGNRVEVDEEVIKRRLHGFELVAEGIARAAQGDDIFPRLLKPEHAKAVKSWLMATQMFKQSGQRDDTIAHFATLTEDVADIPAPRIVTRTIPDDSNDSEIKEPAAPKRRGLFSWLFGF